MPGSRTVRRRTPSYSAVLVGTKGMGVAEDSEGVSGEELGFPRSRKTTRPPRRTTTRRANHQNFLKKGRVGVFSGMMFFGFK